MLMTENRQTIKAELLTTIENLKEDLKGRSLKIQNAPITDLDISVDQVVNLENLTKELEKNNPFPRPLLYNSFLLDGAWLLQYSTAREIRSLSKLPLGFQVGKIYQIIDVNTASFVNQAWVQHSSKLIAGYVKVTAEFQPDAEMGDNLPDNKINVNFLKRLISINKLFGISTPFLEPVKTANANNPPGRVPFLRITYIDDTMRIGRGGEGSLFILTKV